MSGLYGLEDRVSELACIIQPIDPPVAQTGVLARLDCPFAASRTHLFVTGGWPACGVERVCGLTGRV